MKRSVVQNLIYVKYEYALLYMHLRRRFLIIRYALIINYNVVYHSSDCQETESTETKRPSLFTRTQSIIKQPL